MYIIKFTILEPFHVLFSQFWDKNKSKVTKTWQLANVMGRSHSTCL